MKYKGVAHNLALLTKLFDILQSNLCELPSVKWLHYVVVFKTCILVLTVLNSKLTIWDVKASHEMVV